MVTMSPKAPLCALLAALLTLLTGHAAEADELLLRRVIQEDSGAVVLAFTLLDEDRWAVVETARIPIDRLSLRAGATAAELAPVSIDEASLTTLGVSDRAFRVVLLLPNTDLFNGLAGDPNRPDAAGLRAAAADALRFGVPTRDDVQVRAAVYNTNLEWLTGTTGSDLEGLIEELSDERTVAPPGAAAEDPFRAIDLGFAAWGRRAGSNLVTYLLLVTSALTVHQSDLVPEEMAARRDLLAGPEANHVVAMTIVYNPLFDDGTLTDPEGAAQRLGRGITPNRGTLRLVNSNDGFQQALSAAFAEITGTFLLRIPAAQVPESGLFELRLTNEDGALLISNLLHQTTR